MRGLTQALLTLALALTTAGSQCFAAIIELREIEISVDGNGYLREDSLLVQLTEAGDLETWQRYPIQLDSHIELESCTAEVLGSDGKVIDRIPRRRFERLESPGSELYSSGWLSIVPFPALELGQKLRLRYTRRWRPTFPAALVPLQIEVKQLALRVQVQCHDQGFRWQLAHADDSYEVTEQAGSLELRAFAVEAEDARAGSPAWDLSQPILRLAWGEVTDWSGVGRWYQRLVDQAPEPGPEVASLGRKLCRDTSSPRACIELCAKHVKRQVRYEAVEIGEGGWKPTPAAEVLQRGWGDCKDKSLLLKQLLAAAGVPAHLVLIRAGRSGEIDTGFPWPSSFNHAIVAIPEQACGAIKDDPIADGYLFVDPTLPLGGVSWLPPSCQGRPALVIRGGSGELVRTPERSSYEQRHLQVKGRIGVGGSLSGQVRLLLAGSRAYAWVRDLRGKPQDRTEEDVRGYIGSLFPGAKLNAVGWQQLASDTPAFEMTAEVLIANIGQGQAGRRSITPAGLTGFPEPRILDDRTIPVALRTGVHSTEWRISLPDTWCPAKPTEIVVENQVGSFQQTVSVEEDHTLYLQRQVAVRQNLVEHDELDALRELTVAESRTDRRRIRLRCPD
jgi:hypothetical protein